MDAGIDKIVLHTKDFTVKDTSIFGQKRNIPQGKTEQDLPVISVLSQNNEYDHLRANGLYYNEDKGMFNLSVNKTGMQIIFNPSKLLHKYELITDLNEVKKISNQISKGLIQKGILLNLDQCLLSRLDLAKQVYTERNTQSYKPAYEFMRGKRMKSVGYETGYRWGNKQHEYTFYDKGIELGIDIINLLRGEAKFKNARSVNMHSGLRRFDNLFQTDSTHLTTSYNDYMNTKLFNQKYTDQLVLDFDSEVERMRLFMKSRNPVLNFIASMDTTLNGILSSYGSIEVLFNIMAAAGMNKSTISRNRNKIAELMKVQGKTEMNVSILINELKQKFAA